MSLRILTVTLLSVITLALPVSGGRIEVGDDGHTIIVLKVAGLPAPTGTSISNRADIAVIKSFIRKFPEIFKKKYRGRYKLNPKKYGRYDWDRVEIRLQSFGGISVSGIENDLLAIAGNMAPDVLYINFRKSDNYIRNGFLYPLDRFINALSPQEKEWLFKERIHPSILPVIHRRGPDKVKRIWALPYGGNPSGKILMYRKDLFDKHHLSYPDAKWTWHDLYHACKTITAPELGIYGISFGRGKIESWFWLSFLWSAGGEVMVETSPDSDNWSCTFGSEAGVTALDFYTKLCSERWIDRQGIVRRGYAYKDTMTSAKWERGEIGMQLISINEQSQNSFNPEVCGVAPVPKGFDGHRGGELNSTMSGIFGGLTNQVILDAAWEFIHYRDSMEATKIKTQIMVEGGMAQFVRPSYLKRFGHKEILNLTPKSWDELYEISLATGRPEPYGKNSNFAYEQMSIPLQQAETLSLTDRLSEDPLERREQLRKLLTAAQDRANELMSGTIPQAEKNRRRVVAALMLAGICIAYIFVFKKVLRLFARPQTGLSLQSSKWGFRKYFWAYIMLLPAILTIAWWHYLPLIRGSVMAFMDYKILGNSVFVGLDNFGNLIFDNYWWLSIWNALRYSLLVIALTFFPPLVLAIILQEIPKGKFLFRTVYYLPAVISGLVTMLLWKQFYEPSEFGTLNRLVMNTPAIGFVALGAVLAGICSLFAWRLGFYRLWWPMSGFIVAGLVLFFSLSKLAFPVLFPHDPNLTITLTQFIPRLFQTNNEPYRWLFNPDTAMVCSVLPMVWAGMGPGCLIYLAALKAIPDEYYEAADIDGATFIDKIIFVVFPMLKALLIINFVGAFINSWYNSTANVLVMTGGDAATNTETAGLFIWFKAFTFLNFGPATAAAWMLAFMLIGFTLYQLRILNRVEFYSGTNSKQSKNG